MPRGKVKDDKLILYGQCVGSGRTHGLRGVVLQCPILCETRVLYPVKCTYWFDIYTRCFSGHQSFPSGYNFIAAGSPVQIFRVLFLE